MSLVKYVSYQPIILNNKDLPGWLCVGSAVCSFICLMAWVGTVGLHPIAWLFAFLFPFMIAAAIMFGHIQSHHPMDYSSREHWWGGARIDLYRTYRNLPQGYRKSLPSLTPKMITSMNIDECEKARTTLIKGRDAYDAKQKKFRTADKNVIAFINAASEAAETDLSLVKEYEAIERKFGNL